jgi:ribosomal 50S subunit-recycling heat shock protein
MKILTFIAAFLRLPIARFQLLMRLDLFLKASRLSPRRAVAQALCDAGAVSVNGVTAKSSRAVRVGDEISLRRRSHLLIVRVLEVPTTRQTSRADAVRLFEIMSERVISENPLE